MDTSRSDGIFKKEGEGVRRKIIVSLTAAIIIGVAATSYGGVIGSSHDLRTRIAGEDEVCVFCHAPHNAVPAIKPLWNHNLPSESFIMYGTTMLGTVSDPAPNTPSLRCLGCHDGITAIDAYGGSIGTVTLTGDSVIGTDLSKHHPVSIHYDPNRVGAGLDCLACHTFGEGNPDVVFYDAKTECPSCHDPHKTTYGKFLRVSNDGSTLCLICHNK